MIKRMIAVVLMLVLAVTGTEFATGGTVKCTVHYYYTSDQNPEAVPPATAGSKSGASWKIKPAGPQQTVYAKEKNGRAMQYTFDGWYTNINCLGTKYQPGKETTSIEPTSSAAGYTVNFYGRWIFSESRKGGAQEQSPAAEGAAAGGSSTPAETEQLTSASPEEDSTAGPEQEAKPAEEPSGKQSQSITSIAAYAFADSGLPASLGAASSSGLPLEFVSSDPQVVSVDAGGVMQSVSAGSAVITISQSGDEQYEPAEAAVAVTVPGYRGREEALAEWKHLLIDTFFHLNGRKYSFSAPGKYWKDSNGAWSGKTGRHGDTQSCITLPTVTLKRTGIVSPICGNIWLSSNLASTPNGTVKRLKKKSPLLTISYPHKSLKRLAAKGSVKYGDILCRSGHTFVYMGKDSDGHPLIYESGTHRDIGNGTAVTWGHHSGGHANKLTGRINRQIKRSNAQGEKWRKGQLSDDAFKGHRASGKNLHNPVHIVCSINTFTVKTSCVNGTITPGDNYMAGQKVCVSYAPAEGKTLDYVEVDGKRADVAKHSSEYTFQKISKDHTVVVAYQ